jgi:hypothetical protein
VEQPGPKYQPVPREHQKKCLAFLNERVFTRPAWLVEQPYIFTLTDNPDKQLYPLVNNVVSASLLVSLDRMDRMDQFARADASNYSAQEYLKDLHGMIFTELDKGKKVDSYRRFLQTRFVTVALEVVNSARGKTSPSADLLRGELFAIQKKAAKAKSSDPATAAHWQSLATQIDKALK